MMKKHLNNKGYMLVEIILASALAMVVVYFITELTIKLKNKNDDLLVKTLVYTDQAIIYNEIIEDLYKNRPSSPCTRYSFSKDPATGIVTFSINATGFKNVISEYADVDIEKKECNYSASNGIFNMNIPITVKQLPDEDFSIDIKYKLP